LLEQYFFCRSKPMKSFLDPLRRSGSTSLVLTNTRNDRIVADTLLRAFDSESRRRGLLKRDFLPEGSALIIAPTNAIHTFFMRFAIDVAFVAKDGRVLKIRRALAPWRMSAAWGGFAVVELAAGALDRADVQPGDLFRVDAI
jgi:uncharacterized membrane protein (UPF0127 family)